MLFTNHGLCGRSVRRGSESFATRKTAARSLLPGARSRGMARQGAPRAAVCAPSASATRRVGFSPRREARIKQHGFSLSLRRLQGEQPQARPTGFSRITRHETRLLWPPEPSRPPTSHCCSAQNCPELLGKKMSCASVLAPSVVLARLHDNPLSPQFPSPSGLLALRPTPNEPMPRKGNVRYCDDAFLSSLDRPGNYLDTHRPV